MTDRLDAIIGNARRLCNPKADKMIDSFASNATMNEGRMQNVPLDKPDYSYAGFDDDMITEDVQQPQVPQYLPVGENRTRMPKNIVKEMMENPIEPEMPKNRLDEIADKYARIAKREQQTGNIRQPLRESQQTIPAQQYNTGVDYSVLRAIINECIDTKLKEYLGDKKEPLNENCLKGIKLSDGNIKLVDNSGRIFTAKLEYTGKAKK